MNEPNELSKPFTPEQPSNVRKLRAGKLKQLAAASREDPVLAALRALKEAIGTFLLGEAKRHARPVVLVRPDGSNPDAEEQARQEAAVDDAGAALNDAFVRELVDTAPPPLRAAILESMKARRVTTQGPHRGNTTGPVLPMEQPFDVRCSGCESSGARCEMKGCTCECHAPIESDLDPECCDGHDSQGGTPSIAAGNRIPCQ